jgi:hypothetical protein
LIRPVLYAAGELQKPIELVLLERVVANMHFAATTQLSASPSTPPILSVDQFTTFNIPC